MTYRRTKQLREFEPILYRNGYRFARCKGSHFIYINRTSHKIITVNKDLNRMVSSLYKGVSGVMYELGKLC